MIKKSHIKAIEKFYWSMDSETLDRIYDEQIPDIEDEEE